MTGYGMVDRGYIPGKGKGKDSIVNITFKLVLSPTRHPNQWLRWIKRPDHDSEVSVTRGA